MKEHLLSLTAIIYISGLVMCFFGGALGSNKNGGTGYCLQKPTRIEAIFPTYKLGCYLFSGEDKWYYGQNEINNE